MKAEPNSNSKCAHPSHGEDLPESVAFSKLALCSGSRPCPIECRGYVPNTSIPRRTTARVRRRLARRKRMVRTGVPSCFKPTAPAAWRTNRPSLDEKSQECTVQRTYCRHPVLCALRCFPTKPAVKVGQTVVVQRSRPTLNVVARGALNFSTRQDWMLSTSVLCRQQKCVEDSQLVQGPFTVHVSK